MARNQRVFSLILAPSDYEGTTDTITDFNGHIVWSANYETFGSVVSSNGTIDFDATFTGKEFDADTGLYYFNARWQDPTIGRFISSDPARADGWNWVVYVKNNPLRFVDPTGLYPGTDSSDLPAKPVEEPKVKDYVSYIENQKNDPNKLLQPNNQESWDEYIEHQKYIHEGLRKLKHPDPLVFEDESYESDKDGLQIKNDHIKVGIDLKNGNLNAVAMVAAQESEQNADVVNNDLLKVNIITSQDIAKSKAIFGIEDSNSASIGLSTKALNVSGGAEISILGWGIKAVLGVNLLSAGSGGSISTDLAKFLHIEGDFIVGGELTFGIVYPKNIKIVGF